MGCCDRLVVSNYRGNSSEIFVESRVFNIRGRMFQKGGRMLHLENFPRECIVKILVISRILVQSTNSRQSRGDDKQGLTFILFGP